MEKYKEKSPINTINNIQAFFNSKKNFSINIAAINQNPESSTYSCAIELYYKDKIYITANGKGTSKLFCLASGFGELFERFCSEFHIYTNYSLSLKMFKENKNKKILSPNDIINIPFFNDFLMQNNPKELDITDTLFMFDDFLYYKTFKELNNTQKEQQIPISLLYRMVGTTGLSAGNTLEESLVQGLSELCERYVLGQMFLQDNLTYVQIPIKNITNPTNFEIISNILNDSNNKLYIYDLSYNFNLPVCLVVVINTQTKRINFKLGSFPVFDIALERCLTEIYQGVPAGLGDWFHSIQQPYKNINKYMDIYYTSVGSVVNMSFPEHILLKYKEVEQSSNIYYNKQNNINKHIKKLSLDSFFQSSFTN